MKKILMCLLLGASGLCAADASVGLVLDLQGKAFAKTGKGLEPLSILTYLDDGVEITLESGSKLTLSHYQQKNQQTFSGPARLVVKTGEIKVSEGAPAQTITLGEAKSVLANKGLETKRRQAALVMRGFGENSVMIPANRTSVKTATPEFSWLSAEGISPVKLLIFDDEENEILVVDVVENHFKLSKNQSLQPGKKYSWAVLPEKQTAAAVIKKQQFRVLTDEQISLLESQRPSEGSSFADRILYAGLLEELWVKDEAKALWKLLAAERPHDVGLQKMAE